MLCVSIASGLGSNAEAECGRAEACTGARAYGLRGRLGVLLATLLNRSGPFANFDFSNLTLLPFFKGSAPCLPPPL